jgi:hypothetical protein
MLLMVSEAVPLLVSVTSCAALVLPTVWLAKLRLVVERVNFRGGAPSLEAATTQIAVARMIARAKNLDGNGGPGESSLTPLKRPKRHRVGTRLRVRGTKLKFLAPFRTRGLVMTVTQC